MAWFHLVLESPWANKALSSVLLLGGVLLLRYFFTARIKAAQITSADLRRRWIVQIRNGSFFVVALRTGRHLGHRTEDPGRFAVGHSCRLRIGHQRAYPVPYRQFSQDKHRCL